MPLGSNSSSHQNSETPQDAMKSDSLPNSGGGGSVARGSVPSGSRGNENRTRNAGGGARGIIDPFKKNRTLNRFFNIISSFLILFD